MYARWLPNLSNVRAVDLFDTPQPTATQVQPEAVSREWKNAVSAYERMVGRAGIEPETETATAISSGPTLTPDWSPSV